MLRYVIISMFTIVAMCGFATAEDDILSVNWYHGSDAFQPVADAFTEETGIPVTVTDDYDTFTTDVVLVADYKGLLEAKHYKHFDRYDDDFFEKMSAHVPTKWRDADHRWLGFAIRVRTAVVNKNNVQEADYPKTLLDLADPKWRGRLTQRYSSNLYNRSVMAYIVARYGEEKATEWAEGVVANIGDGEYLNDIQIARAVAEGDYDIGFMNSYYLGYLRDWYSDEPEMVKAIDDNLEVVWLDDDGGMFVNVTGVAIGAPVKKGTEKHRQAQALVTFLLSEKGQSLMSKHVFKYPIRSDVEPADFIKAMGDFDVEDFDLNELRYHYDQADKIMMKAGWKSEW